MRHRERSARPASRSVPHQPPRVTSHKCCAKAKITTWDRALILEVGERSPTLLSDEGSDHASFDLAGLVFGHLPGDEVFGAAHLPHQSSAPVPDRCSLTV